MSTDSDASEVTTLAPDDAFAVLGNETRMEILQTLSTAAEPLPFSDLRDRVGMRDSGQFNYHLDKLVGHFVRQTDRGYELRQAGRRIIEAVLSGAVTDVPTLEPTQVDRPCPYCDAPVMVSYDATSPRPVKVSCTECAGAAGWITPFEHGQIGALRFSPAGFHGRTPQELLHAAITWEHLEILAALSDVCPRCSAPTEHTVSVCESHDPADGVCDQCNRPYAAQVGSQCTNCLFEMEEGFAASIVLANVEMLAFLTAHGLNPITDAWGPVTVAADEEILSTAPFKARFTFTMDDDTLTLTMDDDLDVVEVTRG